MSNSVEENPVLSTLRAASAPKLPTPASEMQKQAYRYFISQTSHIQEDIPTLLEWCVSNEPPYATMDKEGSRLPRFPPRQYETELSLVATIYFGKAPPELSDIYNTIDSMYDWFGWCYVVKVGYYEKDQGAKLVKKPRGRPKLSVEELQARAAARKSANAASQQDLRVRLKAGVPTELSEAKQHWRDLIRERKEFNAEIDKQITQARDAIKEIEQRIAVK